MFRKKLVSKWVAFGLSFSTFFSGMLGMSVRAENAGVIAQAEETTKMEDSAMIECVTGQLGDGEYDELVVISEKSADAENIALKMKEKKVAEKIEKKTEKTNEKEDKKSAKGGVKKSHEKISVPGFMKDYGEFWNIVAVGSTNTGISLLSADIETVNPVKVAILDSGVDYTSDIDVYMRKNFIPGQDEVSVIYEDLCGHGTSVAGIIAAKDNDEGITGINPNVQLYSARILDENKQAPASRVAAAIDWAIEQNVDIINLSFGTMTDSETIHAAIRRAYDAGILIVAAAGNNGVIEYPAAYDEVIAVGAVNTVGERAEGSAVGDELELMAPGEQIVSTGVFGGICIVGGTSLAAPHVTAIASVLWQKDRTVSADFIRSLLSYTANQYGENYEYGNGVVDLEFALRQYDAFKEVYAMECGNASLNERVEAAIEDGILEINEKPVVEFTDVTYVEGSWWKDTDGKRVHEMLAEEFSMAGKLTGTDLAIVKLGALAPDRYFDGMYRNSEWHGQEKHRDDSAEYWSNYVYTYMYITEIAENVKKNSVGNIVVDDFTSKISITCAKQDGCKIENQCVTNMQNEIFEKFTPTGMIVEEDGVKTSEKSWYDLLGKRTADAHNVSLYIYGLALHTITDAFAHSAYVDGKRVVHPDADNVEYVPSRYACSALMASYVVNHILNHEVGNVMDFYLVAASNVYDGSFKMGRYGTYIEAIDSTVYKSLKSTLDAITQ